MGSCSSCGSQIDGSGTCSMCYGDPYHGTDGYYLEWLRQQEKEEQKRLEEEQYYEQINYEQSEDNSST